MGYRKADTKEENDKLIKSILGHLDRAREMRDMRMAEIAEFLCHELDNRRKKPWEDDFGPRSPSGVRFDLRDRYGEVEFPEGGQLPVGLPRITFDCYYSYGPRLHVEVVTGQKPDGEEVSHAVASVKIRVSLDPDSTAAYYAEAVAIARKIAQPYWDSFADEVAAERKKREGR